MYELKRNGTAENKHIESEVTQNLISLPNDKWQAISKNLYNLFQDSHKNNVKLTPCGSSQKTMGYNIYTEVVYI